MPDLLLEFLSEEIPARMQGRAAEDLRKMVTDRLVAAGLVYEGAKAFVTPRRLALSVHGVPVRQPDIKEEKKGPRLGAPEGAIAGFLKAAGLKSISEAKVQPDKKGDFYLAVIEKAGRPALDVIAEMIPEVVRGFPWPKSMRWGSGKLTWVRPLHSILATFGPETEEPELVKFSVDGIATGDETRGHRFMAPGAIKVRHFGDYLAKLQAAKVVLDPARRAEMILADAKNLAFAQGYELIEDDGLLAEVAGLVEWPVTLMGSFDEGFLAIPQEVIRATIRNNQKCFVLRSSSTSPLVGEVGAQRRVGGGRDDTQSPPPPTPPHKGEGRLAPKFILVANEEASDGGKAIIAGNERVIRARLSDAKFFYETDLKTKLEARLPKLSAMLFHEKLGTQRERIERLQQFAQTITQFVNFRPADAQVTKVRAVDVRDEVIGTLIHDAQRAALLAKADLVTDMVGEFPELQGLMGRYYAEAQGESETVAHAIEDHYKPKGPDDLVPAEPVSIIVALADKIDMLVGFWGIDEKPTGSKDPYALRRAALGVIRIILDNTIGVRLGGLLQSHFSSYIVQAHRKNPRIQQAREELAKAAEARFSRKDPSIKRGKKIDSPESSEKSVLLAPLKIEIDFDNLTMTTGPLLASVDAAVTDLLSFFADRLKVQLREQGARHDLVDAVFALEGQDDLLLIVRRVEALGKFLDSDDGKNLLAGVKRASNILRIEEKKDNKSYTGAPDAKKLNAPEEKALAEAVNVAKKDASAAVAKEDFAAAMTAMAKLRPRVDAFFDKVTVNVDDKALRENRLKLLNEIREATRAVADFSKIEG